MSRNVRYNPPKSPPSGKKSVKKSRVAAASTESDSDYDAVDLVEDSEEDETDVLAAEEQAMLQPSEDESDDDDTATAASQPLEDSNDIVHGDWEGIALDSDNSSNTQHFGHAIDAFAMDGRHVHWDDDNDESEDSQVYDDLFPDIFVQQDQLDPTFRREMETENDDSYVSDDGSFQGWGMGPEAAQSGILDEVESQDGTSSEDSFSGSSSGYESEGETTDEDIDATAVSTVVATKDILRRTSTDSSSLSELDEPELAQPIQRVRRPNGRRGPILANWITVPGRPYAFADEKKKKIVVVKNRINGQMSTPLRPIPQYHAEFSLDESPLMGNAGTMMFTGLFPQGLNDGAAVGPPEAFYPFVNVNADGSHSLDEHSSYEDEDDDGSNLWDNIQDMIDFGEDSDESNGSAQEGEDDNDQSDELGEEHGTTPCKPSRSRSGSRASTARPEPQLHPLLEHFERNPVGAFKSNQTRHALLSRNRITKESLAFNGPYGAPIRGIKHDRMAAANVPITPARRAKLPKINITPSPAAVTSNAKRKMPISDMNVSHKRAKSTN